MRTITRTTLTICALGLSLIACRGGSSDDDDDDIPDAPPGGFTIQEVQSDDMAPGTAVELHGVVVVAIDKFGMRKDDIYVMEPDGGEYSGVHVFGGPPDKVGALAPGDIISITGAVKDEFALASDTSGRTITELKPASEGSMGIVKTGDGSVPEPKVVDALAIGLLPTQDERNAEWEKWEGVLVTVNKVTSFNSPKCVGSACTDKTLETVDVTGGLVLESALAEFPTGVTKAGCLASATGIVDYFFDYLLYQRSADDIATGGAGCPAPEATQDICGDDIDNDGNGFKDCEDNGCIVAEATCRMTTSISAIQAATPTDPIELSDVFITAVSDNGYNLWVSTSLTAAANQGVFIYGNGTKLPATFVPGAKVKVIGRVKEYNNDTMGESLTEVEAIDVTLNTAGAGLVVPVTKTAAELNTATTGEPYEGALVRLTNVKVMAAADDHGVAQLMQDTTMFLSDDNIEEVTEAVGTCFTEIVGIWSYQVNENAYTIEPITKPTGTTCN